MTTKLTMDDILLDFPAFNETHIKFFERLIELTKQDRLALVPSRDNYDTYVSQYVSLVSKEQEYEWLIQAIHAVAAAKQAERVQGADFDPATRIQSGNTDVGFSDKELQSLI